MQMGRYSEIEQPILFISYFTGMTGNCPAEWADDKIDVLNSQNVKVYVLTGLLSSGQDTPTTKFFKVPSLADDDFKHEIRLSKLSGLKKVFINFLMRPLVFAAGAPIRWLTSKITSGGSGGKWSWTILALPIAIWICLLKRPKIIFCTGGPPAAHLVGSIANIFIKTKLIHEFQDPLVGAKINQSKYKKTATRLLEKYFISRSQTTAYVTQKASLDSQKRYPECSAKICSYYPGSRRFLHKRPPMITKGTPSTSRLEFLHLGTLYGSRNLDIFFDAIDSCYAKNTLDQNQIEVTNLGSVYCENRDDYIKRKDFQILDERPRESALLRAAEAQILLLVQHDDARSKETIPYKVYDYLNLGLPIFALVDNPELKILLEKTSVVALTAKPSDPDDISKALNQLADLVDKHVVLSKRVADRIDIDLQFSQLLTR